MFTWTGLLNSALTNVLARDAVSGFISNLIKGPPYAR